MTRTNRNRIASIVLLAAGASLLSEAGAADAVAGKAKVDQACAECHRSTDWSGESAQALESLMRDIVAGKIKHSKRPLKLTPEEIVNIAAYWTGQK